MRNETYKSEVAFTKSELLYCKFICQCGGCNDWMITCVHNLPIIFQLCMLLVDGLAEHILLELSARINLHDDVNIKIKTESVWTLMAASGEDIHYSDGYKSIHVLLERFSVGTDKRKK